MSSTSHTETSDGIEEEKHIRQLYHSELVYDEDGEVRVMLTSR